MNITTKALRNPEPVKDFRRAVFLTMEATPSDESLALAKLLTSDMSKADKAKLAKRKVILDARTAAAHLSSITSVMRTSPTNLKWFDVYSHWGDKLRFYIKWVEDSELKKILQGFLEDLMLEQTLPLSEVDARNGGYPGDNDDPEVIITPSMGTLRGRLNQEYGEDLAPSEPVGLAGVDDEEEWYEEGEMTSMPIEVAQEFDYALDLDEINELVYGLKAQNEKTNKVLKLALNNFTLDVLQTQAKKLGIPYSSKTKEELITELAGNLHPEFPGFNVILGFVKHQARNLLEKYMRVCPDEETALYNVAVDTSKGALGEQVIEKITWVLQRGYSMQNVWVAISPIFSIMDDNILDAVPSLSTFIDNFGDEILEEAITLGLDFEIVASLTSSKNWTKWISGTTNMEDINRFAQKVREEYMAQADPESSDAKNTPVYVEAYFNAIDAGVPDPHSKALAAWRHWKSPRGARAFAKIVSSNGDRGKLVSQAWASFNNAGKVIALSQDGLKVITDANGEEVTVLHRFVPYKSKSGELYISDDWDVERREKALSMIAKRYGNHIADNIRDN